MKTVTEPFGGGELSIGSCFPQGETEVSHTVMGHWWGHKWPLQRLLKWQKTHSLSQWFFLAFHLADQSGLMSFIFFQVLFRSLCQVLPCDLHFINKPGPTVVDKVRTLSHLTFTGALQGQDHCLPEPREVGNIPELANGNAGWADPRAHPRHLVLLSRWQDHNLLLSKINSWTKVPGRLQSMGSEKSRTRLSD